MPSWKKPDDIYRFDHSSFNAIGGHGDFYQIGRICDVY